MPMKDKGQSFEYDIVALFQNQGYLTRRAVPVLNDLRQDATDIDILAIKFVHPFRENRIMCDCKNKVKPKSYERIFWAKGVGEFNGISDVYVALPKASWDIIKFANDGNVKIITEDIIEEYLSISSKALGIADEDYFETRFMNIAKTDMVYKELLSFYREVKLLYIHKNPYTSLNSAIDKLRLAAKKISFFEQSQKENASFSWRYVAYDLICLISIMLLRISADVLGLSREARTEHIRSRLTFGEIEPSKATSLINGISKLANEIIKGKIGLAGYMEGSHIDLGSYINTPPGYTDDIIGLVERALHYPDWYISLPQILSYLLFEVAIKNKVFNIEDFEREFGKDFSQEKIKTAKNILSLVKSTCAFNIRDIFIKNETVETVKTVNTVNTTE